MKLYNKIRKCYLLNMAKRSLGSYGPGLYIGGKCKFNKNVEVGRNVSFNGMSVLGGGHVTIGDNFHSGIECMIITQNHNYEGTEIPYDSTFIY